MQACTSSEEAEGQLRSLQQLFVLIMVKRTILISALVVVALCGVATPFALSWYESSSLSWPREEFSTQKWSSTPRIERYRMYRDLTNKVKLVGASRDQVQAALGKPDSVAPDGRYVTYVLKEGGEDRYTLNFIYFLKLEFGSDGKVMRQRLGSD